MTKPERLWQLRRSEPAEPRFGRYRARDRGYLCVGRGRIGAHNRPPRVPALLYALRTPMVLDVFLDLKLG